MAQPIGRECEHSVRVGLVVDLRNVHRRAEALLPRRLERLQEIGCGDKGGSGRRADVGDAEGRRFSVAELL